MISVVGLDHIVLRAHDAPRLIEFYGRVLGCAVERTVAEFGLTQLRAGNALIDIVAVDGKLGSAGGAGPGDEGNNLDHFCVLVTPQAESDLLADLDAHGIPHGEFAERYGATGMGRSIYIDDPEGNTVEIKIQGMGR